MSSSSVLKSAEQLINNRLLTSAISLGVLIAGVVTVSTPLLILSGVLAYGWPLLHVYVTDLNNGSNKSAKPARKAPAAIGTSAFVTR